MSSQAAQQAARKARVSATGFTAGALVFALAFSFILARVLSGHVSDAPVQPVVVAAVQVPAFTKLTEQHLKIMQWPETSIPPGAYKDVKTVLAQPVMNLRALLPGEPLVPQRIDAANSGAAIPNLLPPRKRAFVVRVDDSLGVASLLAPGVVVDVLAVMEPEGKDQEPTAKIVLQKIPILAVGKSFDVTVRQVDEKAKPDARMQRIVTLVVSPEEAEILVFLVRESKIDVAIRPTDDVAPVETTGASRSMLIKPAVGTGSGAGVADRKDADANKKKNSSGPMIYRVGQ